jgi:hypothetical protein
METKAYPEISDKEFQERLINMIDAEEVADLAEVQLYYEQLILEEYEEENEHFLNYDTVLGMFTDGATIEEMRIKYHYDDIALREDFNNYTDMLCKDGTISEWAYNNWDNPF